MQLNTLKILPLQSKADWNKLHSETKFITQWGKKTLSTGVEKYAKSVVIEPF